MILPKDFNDLLSLLNDYGAEYLVIGGYAVAAHGYPRFTSDLDIWTNPDVTNADRVCQALLKYGIHPSKLPQNALSKPKTLITFGREPIKIEILTTVNGVEFGKSFKNRLVLDLDGLQVNFIGFNDLLKNKKATGRPEDLADVSRLTRKQKNVAVSYRRPVKRKKSR